FIYVIIWCNLCIDLVAFTSEIFKGAVFQSLDGIIVSANCKLRKIFTLKSKPQDTADKDAGYGVPFPTDEPTDIIPRSCQLTTDVPQVTQLLNMTKLRQTIIKLGGHPLSSAESDQFLNRGTGSVRNSKNQDVCHIAFGSKVLGPPPLSGRRNNMRISSETIRSIGSKNNRSCQPSTVERCVNNAEMSALLISESEEQGDKENIRQIKLTVPVRAANLHIMHPHPPQEPSADKNNNRRRLRLKSTNRERTETPSGSSSGNSRNGDKAAALITESQQGAGALSPSTPAPQSPDASVDERVFLFSSFNAVVVLFRMKVKILVDERSCHTSPLWLETSKESEQDQQAEETWIVPKDVFTFSSRPRSAPHGKTQNMSPEGCPFILDLTEDTSVTQLEDDFYGEDSSEEGNYSVQDSPRPTTSPSGLTQLTLESMMGKAARWTSKEYLKSAYTEAEASESQNLLVQQIDRNNFQPSLVPVPCLSPPGRSSELFQNAPDPIIKAKDQVPASVNKASLKEISEEKLRPSPGVAEYDWRNYQPSQMSKSELQMLASLRQQQNDDLEDTGASHGLSASQVDNCNVSISTSSDDTTTWNSCLPPPVNQGRHYQKEMNPPSPSNPRDWLNMLSPPIVPPSRQPAEQNQDSSGSLTAQGEEDLSVEEDEEVLTLLYDPCLNCYFDPQTGKYYELV
uniref:CFAP20 domain containing n=1 Tax=Myotis lucifugus TaxID=59463 RepID=G1NYS8_MYOLU